MKNKKLAYGMLAVLAILGIGFVVLKKDTVPIVSHGGPVNDYVSFIDNLRATGDLVEPAGEISQPFFSVKGFVVKVNGEEVQAFEYLNATVADSEAELVSPDGASAGTSIITWVATPHFYKEERLIVLYVGDNEALINILETILGPQFAGG